MRTPWLFAICFLLTASAFSQSNKKYEPDAGYVPTVAPEDKGKKKKEERKPWRCLRSFPRR